MMPHWLTSCWLNMTLTRSLAKNADFWSIYCLLLCMLQNHMFANYLHHVSLIVAKQVNCYALKRLNASRIFTLYLPLKAHHSSARFNEGLSSFSFNMSQGQTDIPSGRWLIHALYCKSYVAVTGRHYYSHVNEKN